MKVDRLHKEEVLVKVVENRVLREISGCKRKEVAGGVEETA